MSQTGTNMDHLPTLWWPRAGSNPCCSHCPCWYACRWPGEGQAANCRGCFGQKSLFMSICSVGGSPLWGQCGTPDHGVTPESCALLWPMTWAPDPCSTGLQGHWGRQGACMHTTCDAGPAKTVLRGHYHSGAVLCSCLSSLLFTAHPHWEPERQLSPPVIALIFFHMPFPGRVSVV